MSDVSPLVYALIMGAIGVVLIGTIALKTAMAAGRMMALAVLVVLIGLAVFWGTR